MPLTPADVHNASFRKSSISRRGYEQEDVDAFLYEVEQELVRLLEENGALHDQVQGRGPGDAGPATSVAMTDALADVVARLERMRELRTRAERNARSLQLELEQARDAASAAPVPADEDGQVDRVLNMARRTADDHVRDARQESEAVLSAARAEAGEIADGARLRADAIAGDAHRGHVEAMDNLAAERGAVLEEIDQLGRLARGYQAALADHLDRQLSELSGDREPSENAVD